MLQPDLLQLMAMGGSQTRNGDEEEGFREAAEQQEEGNPFTFNPQLLRLHRDHELFEVTTSTGRQNACRNISYHL